MSSVLNSTALCIRPNFKFLPMSRVLNRKLAFNLIIIVITYACVHLSLGAEIKKREKAKLSERLSQEICKSVKKFGVTNKLEPPLKFPFLSDIPCRVLSWNKCAGNVPCTKFQLKQCSASPSPSPSKSKPDKTKPNNETLSSSDGKPSELKVTTRIVGGLTAKPHEFPHQVHFGMYNPKCGGTLLSENFVLSAAHCFVNNPAADDWLVTAGDHDYEEVEGTEQQVQIGQIINHAEYDDDTKVNDISLILLDSPFKLNMNVKPAILPKAKFRASGNVWVTGWGALKYKGYQPDALQKVRLPLVSNAKCKTAYEDVFEVTEKMLCAGFLGKGGKDACQGDSGGPLGMKMANGSFLLIGVVSNGLKCADKNYPGVYTDVAKYADWISTNMKAINLTGRVSVKKKIPVPEDNAGSYEDP